MTRTRELSIDIDAHHSSEEFAQIHASIETRNLVGIAVERQRRVALGEEAAFPDLALGFLGPARMIDFRIHVRVEAVFVGVLPVPTSWWHFRNHLIRTIDLMPLKPYFQGTTKRKGAPFWLGRPWS